MDPIEKIKVMNGIFDLLLQNITCLTPRLREKASDFYKRKMIETVKLGREIVVIPPINPRSMKIVWSRARNGQKWIEGKRPYTIIPLIYCQKEGMIFWDWNIAALTPDEYEALRRGREYFLISLSLHCLSIIYNLKRLIYLGTFVSP